MHAEPPDEPPWGPRGPRVHVDLRAALLGRVWLAGWWVPCRGGLGCSLLAVPPQVRAAPLLARTARGAADGGRVVRPVEPACALLPCCCSWLLLAGGRSVGGAFVCSVLSVAPQVRAAPLLARSARGAADGGRVVRPVAVARSVGPIVCCCWMGDRRQPPVGGRSCQCVLSAADGAQVRRRPSWSVAAVPAALPRHCRRRTALPVTVAVRMASRAVGAVETVGEAAVVGRRSSGERSEIVGWGVRCHLPPCTPERPRMRTRPTGSPHLQRTGSKVV